MSGKGPYHGQTTPKYINDFSKALANEVRILLQEVGQLRDERRQLQYEIAELMAVKSKHGAGGEYTPDWKPKEKEPEAPPPPPPEPVAPAPAKPAWRNVNVRQERKNRAAKQAGPKGLPAPGLGPAPGPAPAPSIPQGPAWAQWKPAGGIISPTPVHAPPPAGPPPPSRPQGLFGPRTPPPK